MWLRFTSHARAGFSFATSTSSELWLMPEFCAMRMSTHVIVIIGLSMSCSTRGDYAVVQVIHHCRMVEFDTHNISYDSSGCRMTKRSWQPSKRLFRRR